MNVCQIICVIYVFSSMGLHLILQQQQEKISAPKLTDVITWFNCLNPFWLSCEYGRELMAYC
jgi:hypothetical protein